MYAYLGAALVVELFYLAYFGPAKMLELHAKGGNFKGQEEKHRSMLPLGSSLHRRQWNKGKHGFEEMRRVVTFTPEFLKVCLFRFELYRALASAVIALLDGYNTITMRRGVQIHEMLFLPAV